MESSPARPRPAAAELGGSTEPTGTRTRRRKGGDGRWLLVADDSGPSRPRRPTLADGEGLALWAAAAGAAAGRTRHGARWPRAERQAWMLSST